MNQIFKRTALASSVAMTLAIAPAVHATNGMEAVGLGQTHKAMGGASVGNPQNTMSMASNPASINNIASGFDVGAEIFNPDRQGTNNGSVDPTQAGRVFEGNGRDYFFIPEGGYKKRSNGSNKSFGVVAYGSGGMNTWFDGNNPPVLSVPGQGTFPFNFDGVSASTGVPPGINLEQLVVAPTLGIKLNDKHSFGISLDLKHQRFKATGLSAFQNPAFTVDPTSVTDKGYDSSSGIGATIGWQGKLTDQLTMGLAYRTKTNMGKLKKYKGLFPNGGELDLPAALSVGFGFDASPKTNLAFDVKHIYYSDVDSMGNDPTIIPAGAPVPAQQIGGTVGFGWEDQTIYKVGVKHQLNPTLALMGGFNYGENPVTDEGTNLNLLAPGITEKHLTLGFEKKLSKDSSITASYIRTFSKTLKAGAVGPGLIPQQYDLKMDQHALGIGYTKTF